MAKKELIEFILKEMKNKNLNMEKGKEFLKEIVSNNDDDEMDIAIVGMSCRFPDADSIEEFWKNLLEEKDSVGTYPKERLNDLLRIDERPNNAMCGGFLKHVDQFDPGYFGISPKAAIEMDPYHRIMLEVFVEALENAGYYMEQIQGKKVGVYVGNDVTHRLIRSYFSFLSEVSFSALVGSWTSILASRISYLFNLKGPAMVLDTGCSSALTALDAAIKGIRNKDCESAFVGGVNLLFDPSALAEQTLSEDYIVRSFDNNANGTVWSEGAGGIYLKPLEKAVKDGDSIYGIIKGIAVNCDGRSNGITAPNAQAQAEVISEAWNRSGINPDKISYIETHGTGTILGDPIEIKGLSQAYKMAGVNKKQICGIGTVKSNIGHAVGAAGMASLIKVLLAFQHEILPASINFKSPNQFIDFCNSPFYLQDRTEAWRPDETEELVAGINGFSLGGTNVHVVLESYKRKEQQGEKRSEPVPFCISNIKKELLLKDLYRQFFYLKNSKKLNNSNICYTLGTGRKRKEFRTAFCCKSMEELMGKLERTIEILESGEEIDSALERIYIGNCGTEVPEKISSEKISAPESVAIDYVFGDGMQVKELFQRQPGKHVNLPPSVFDNHRVWDENTVKRVWMQEHKVETEEEVIAEILDGQKTYLEDTEEITDACDEIAAWIWKKVLGFERINYHADFYKLGGDSINALTIIQMVRSVFEVQVKNSLVLEHSEFSDFVNVLKNDYSISVQGRKEIEKQKEEDETEVTQGQEHYLELTSSQKSIFLSVYGREPSVTYNISGVAKNKGKADKEKLQEVIQKLVKRHESLRTSFGIQDGKPVQCIHPTVETSLEEYKLIEKPGVDERELLKEMLDKVIRPFDLEKAPLFRISYIEGLSGNSYLVFDIHHIIADGFAMGILYRDFVVLMKGQHLASLPMNYGKATETVCQLENSRNYEDEKEWWKNQFVEEVPKMELFTRKYYHAEQERHGEIISYQIEKSLYSKFEQLAAKYKTTKFVMLMGTLQMLLSMYSGEKDIVIGTPIAGRVQKEYNNIIGMFVNTLPIRICRESKDSYLKFIQKVKRIVLDSFRNQDYSYEQLINDIEIPYEKGKNPLFDVYFAMQNIDMGLDDSVEFIDYHNGTAKFELTVTARENPDGLFMQWEYDAGLYEKSMIEQMAKRFEKLMMLACEEREEPLTSADIMLDGEAEYIKNTLGTLGMPKVLEKSICDIFEATVSQKADEVFLVGAKQNLTFSEVNRYANYVAEKLITSGVQEGEPVALMIDHSCEMVISILAILKSGAYYVPMHTGLPKERLKTMLVDSDAKVILTQKEFVKNVKEATGDEMVCLLFPDRIESDTVKNINRTKSSEDKAYMMYTSGTTNVPKGIIIRNRNIMRVVKDNGYVEFLPDDVLMSLANYSFDGSIFDIFGAILNGLKLVIPTEDEVIDMCRLTDIIREQNVTVFFITTSLFNALIDTSLDKLRGIRKIVFGGEAASLPHVKRACDYLGGGHLVNGYGPTETCVFASAYTFEQVDNRYKIPIGHPISNTQLLVLDEHRRMQPIGIPGELYIGGAGVGDGYYKQEERTAESFIQTENGCFYKSGDYAVWKEDGNLYYMGRKDKQIKLRGYRIERDEINGIAMSVPCIKSAYSDLYVSESNNRTLCLWVIPDKTQEYNEHELKMELQRKLPQYMNPSFIIPVDEFPITKNGKVDSRNLPRPQEESEEIQYRKPENETEERLAKIWEDVLGLNKIGIEDNFFNIGGDSIKAIQIVSRVKEFGLQLSMKDIFQCQTIQNLAKVATVFECNPDNYEEGAFGPEQMSAVQKQFLIKRENRMLRFTQALKLTIPAGITLEQVKAAWSKICQCHSMLRLYIEEDDRIEIREKDNAEIFEAVQGNISKLDENEFVELENKINIQNGPISVLMLYPGEKTSTIKIAIHHMAVDVMSWGIIIEDFIKCLKEPNAKLIQEITTFSMWTRQCLVEYSGPAREKEISYWTSIAGKLEDEDKFFPEANAFVITKNLKHIKKNLSGQSAVELMGEVRESYDISMQNLALCILSLALSQWKNRKKVLINVERHGRETFGRNMDLSRTAGWFTSYCPVIIENQNSVGELIKSIKDIEFNIPNAGAGYGILKYLIPNLDAKEKSVMDAIQPEINYNFLGKQDITGAGNISYYNGEVCVAPEYATDWIMDIVADYTDAGIGFDIQYAPEVIGEEDIQDFMVKLEDSADFILEDYKNKGDITACVTNSTSDITENELENILDELMF